MKKRIALFHDLPSGGAKRFLYESINQLKKDFTIDVFTLPDRDKDELFSLKGFVNKVFYFGKPQKTDNYKNAFERLSCDFYALFFERLVEKKIANYINHHNYDLSFVNHSRFTHAPYLLKYLKIPSVYFCQEPPRQFYEKEFGILKKVAFYKKIYEKGLRKIKKNIDIKNSRSATKILANSFYSKKIIEAVYQKKAQVCYLGIDPKKFMPMAFKKQKLILSVGNSEPQKAHDFLIKSLSLIPEKIRPRLLIVGNKHPEKENLQKLANILQVQVLWEEQISDNKLVKRYNQALLIATASLREPFGLAVLEAASCGLPVVAIAEAGIKETVVNGETGFLVNRDKKEMAEKILTLLKNKNLRKKMGQNARSHVLQQWSLEKAINNLKKALQ